MIRAHQRDFLADVLMQEFRGLEEVVFIVLFDDAEFFWIVQGTEMNRRGIDGCGDVHELQAKCSAGEGELPNVAHQRDVRVVNGDV